MSSSIVYVYFKNARLSSFLHSLWVIWSVKRILLNFLVRFTILILHSHLYLVDELSSKPICSCYYLCVLKLNFISLQVVCRSNISSCSFFVWTLILPHSTFIIESKGMRHCILCKTQNILQLFILSSFLSLPKHVSIYRSKLDVYKITFIRFTRQGVRCFYLWSNDAK